MSTAMSKITFRADEDLVERLETFDASKSEVMRDALREYLDRAERETGDAATVDDALADRIDDLIAERLDAHLDRRDRGHAAPAPAQDINVNVTLDGATAETETRTAESAPAEPASDDDRKTGGANAGDAATGRRKTCEKCGENVGPDQVYCPNCGEKASHRVFCDCGDELRSDWAFCPSCGRRTPAADVLDRP
jgi:Arc/MetJ-type ribon-helix-helix transcriptional regulator